MENTTLLATLVTYLLDTKITLTTLSPLQTTKSTNRKISTTTTPISTTSVYNSAGRVTRINETRSLVAEFTRSTPPITRSRVLIGREGSINSSSPTTTTLPPMMSKQPQEKQSITRPRYNQNVYRHPRLRAHRIQNRGGATPLDDSSGMNTPMTGAIVLGSIFLFISLFLTTAVVVFCKKKNTVFVFQKSEQQDYEEDDEDSEDEDSISFNSIMPVQTDSLEGATIPHHSRGTKLALNYEGYRKVAQTRLNLDSAWLARPWLHGNDSSGGVPSNRVNDDEPPTGMEDRNLLASRVGAMEAIKVVLHCQNDIRNVSIQEKDELGTERSESRSSDDCVSLVMHSALGTAASVSTHDDYSYDEVGGEGEGEAGDKVSMEMSSLGLRRFGQRRMTGSLSVDKFSSLVCHGHTGASGHLRKSKSFHQSIAMHQV